MFFRGNAGSLPSEKGSCRLTLLLGKRQKEEGLVKLMLMTLESKDSSVKILNKSHLDPGGIWA